MGRLRIRTVLVPVAVVALVVGAGVVMAQDGGVVFHACANPHGLLRLVADPSQCLANETAIWWNQVGPQGPQGPPGTGGGAGGYYTVTADNIPYLEVPAELPSEYTSLSTESQYAYDFIVSCEPGDVAVSGSAFVRFWSYSFDASGTVTPEDELRLGAVGLPVLGEGDGAAPIGYKALGSTMSPSPPPVSHFWSWDPESGHGSEAGSGMELIVTCADVTS